MNSIEDALNDPAFSDDRNCMMVIGNHPELSEDQVGVRIKSDHPSHYHSTPFVKCKDKFHEGDPEHFSSPSEVLNNIVSTGMNISKVHIFEPNNPTPRKVYEKYESE